MKAKHYLLAVMLLAIFMTGYKKSNSGSSNGRTDKYFDFATTEKYTLRVDYNLYSPGYTSGILFEVYDKDPYKISNDDSVVSRSDIKPAFEILEKEEIDIAIVDVKLSEVDGIEVLKRIKKEYNNIEIILISGHGDIHTAIEVFRNGASNYKKLILKALECCNYNKT